MSQYHVYPTRDLIKHETEGDDCVCGPEFEKQESGNWVVIHHALDGDYDSDDSGTENLAGPDVDGLV